MFGIKVSKFYSSGYNPGEKVSDGIPEMIYGEVHSNTDRQMLQELNCFLPVESSLLIP